MATEFKWIDFYTDFATKLLTYKKQKKTLMIKLQKVFSDIGMKMHKLWDDDSIPEYIDPFTIFGMFNKRMGEDKRTKIIQGLAHEFGVNAEIPTVFTGIPVLLPTRVNFYYYPCDMQDIDNLWEVFDAALTLADNDNDENRANFSELYNIVQNQEGVKWNLTMGLYWMRPYRFINLDSRNRSFLKKPKNSNKDIAELVASLRYVPEAETYLEICDMCLDDLKKGRHEYKTFPELSATAFEDKDIHYWVYAPGEKAYMWKEFYEKGIMAIGWPQLGDLSVYNDKEELTRKMQEVYGGDSSYKNNVLAVWQFANGMTPDDVIFVKRGRSEILGYGVVTSDYVFDDKMDTEYPNIRKVDWKENGTWQFDGSFPVKTITDITDYPDDIEKIMNLFEKDTTPDSKISTTTIKFFTGYESSFERNRILFGAPGTGKSYTLNKDAEELLGKDYEENCERVTFHPDYSYAHFVGTYKPVPCVDENSNSSITYEYVPGPFMRVYVNALKNSRTETIKPFLLIIEEINRANVAAVFGDIFQLLDRDDDNVSDYPIQASEDIKKYLAKELGGQPDDYKKIRIPDNMFIWATMNSADQGVFPVDTAFKRRWEFTYIGIDDSDVNIRGKYVVLGEKNPQRIEWNKLRKAINHFLAKEKINEDKQLGPYFISRKIAVPDGDEIDHDAFVRTFKNKVLMYLFEDAAKQKRSKLFAGCTESGSRYSEVCREFDEKGIGIFNLDIQTEAEPEELEEE